MSIPYDQRCYHIKAEVLEMMKDGYLLKTGPFGAWMEHPEKDEWCNHHVHGNSFRALIADGLLKLKIRLGEAEIWELA